MMSGSQQALIADYLGLVRSIATHMAQSLPRFIELNDLMQTGMLGLIEAARKYDPTQQVAFPTYASHRIRGAILDSLRREDSLSRDMRNHQKRIHAVEHRVRQEQQREATAPEIAAALGIDIKRLDAIRLRIEQGREVYTDHPSEEGLPKMEYPDRPEDRPDALLERSRLKAEVLQAVEQLPERQRLVLHLYYVEELTMREIGAILGVNESRVSQIHKRAASDLAGRMKPHMARRAAA